MLEVGIIQEKEILDSNVFQISWCFEECYQCFSTALLLVFVTYIVVSAHKQIHHWFFRKKSAQDIGSFENGNSVQRKKKWNERSDV